MLRVDRIMMERKITDIDNGINKPFGIEGEGKAESSSEDDIEMKDLSITQDLTIEKVSSNIANR